MGGYRAVLLDIISSFCCLNRKQIHAVIDARYIASRQVEMAVIPKMTVTA